MQLSICVSSMPERRSAARAIPFLCLAAFLLSPLLVAPTLQAQVPVDYGDVGLIINDSDTNSVAIGAYFAQKRDIPLRNIIHVTAPSTESIDSTKFEALRAQIETYLTTHNLTDSLNYLVTTKGVPLRVWRWNDGLSSRASSVDAELMLILGPYASHIGQATTVIINPNNTANLIFQPYFGQNAHFSRAQYGVYLVTRLIALTRGDVLALIDRSGPNTVVPQDSALFVFDRDPRPIDAALDGAMATASATLRSRGWNTLLNQDSVYVTDQRHVTGYVSWGSNDHYDHRYAYCARPRNTWTPASIAETYVSTSARNFMPGDSAGQSRIADLLAEGCTGASGYVYEPYSFSLSQPQILFERYTNGYNLAESYYMSNPTMSWMAVVVGDPKATLISAMPAVPHPVITPVAPLCAGGVAVLEAHNVAAGAMNWFAGDSAAVQAAGAPYDRRHPLWIGQDSALARVIASAGLQRFTFVNLNIAGIGFAEVAVDVRERPAAGFTVSADTLILDENATVACTDTTQRATQWTWTFGDGSAPSSERNPSHTYLAAGNFRVQLTASDGFCAASAERTIVVLRTRPRVALSAQALDFGLTQVAHAKQRTIRLYNLQPRALSVSAISASGVHAAEFAFTPPALPRSVKAYDSLELAVAFTPADTGARGATLTFTTDEAAGATHEAQLSGIGTLDPVDARPVPAAAFFTLAQNFPNPASAQTVIPYTLARAGRAVLSVSSALGVRVATLIDAELQAGRYGCVWNTAGTPPGRYFCELEMNGEVQRIVVQILR